MHWEKNVEFFEIYDKWKDVSFLFVTFLKLYYLVIRSSFELIIFLFCFLVSKTHFFLVQNSRSQQNNNNNDKKKYNLNGFCFHLKGNSLRVCSPFFSLVIYEHFFKCFRCLFFFLWWNVIVEFSSNLFNGPFSCLHNYQLNTIFWSQIQIRKCKTFSSAKKFTKNKNELNMKVFWVNIKIPRMVKTRKMN